MVMNPPTVKVALVILAAPESPGSISRTLDWLRHRMPRCPVTVVGDFGCGQHEMAAREGGAFYLTRPVEPDQLSAILAHVLTTARYERTVTPGWGLAANTSRES
jgi:DNA-binding response OmpR family regulator